jgi:hypothetical protein
MSHRNAKTLRTAPNAASKSNRPAFRALNAVGSRSSSLFDKLDDGWEIPWSEPQEFRPGCGPDFESSDSVFPDAPVTIVREVIRCTATGRTLRERTVKILRGAAS